VVSAPKSAHLGSLFDVVNLVIIGGTHDSGYAPLFRNLEEREPGKIVLLRTGLPCAPSIALLHLTTIRFEPVLVGGGYKDIGQPALSLHPSLGTFN
jgi:hypothetical protein